MSSLKPRNSYETIMEIYTPIRNILHNYASVPVPPGSIKFSHSARLMDLNVRICDSDFDIINITLSGLELDFLFRANERFVFRSFLSNILVEHLSEITLYNKVSLILFFRIFTLVSLTVKNLKIQKHKCYVCGY